MAKKKPRRRNPKGTGSRKKKEAKRARGNAEKPKKGAGEEIRGEITISSPMTSNPCHPVDSGGKIAAAGAFQNGELVRIVAAVVAGTPNPVPSTPSGISPTEDGYIDSGSDTWEFRSPRLVPGARSGCQQETLLVWGYFSGVANPDYKNRPFRGQDGTVSCSGVMGSVWAPAFDKLAPTQYVLYVPPVQGDRNASDSRLYLAGEQDYLLEIDPTAPPDAPVWVLKVESLPRGIEWLRLMIRRTGGDRIAVLDSKEEKDRQDGQVTFTRRFWSSRSWNFVGMNYVHFEPYGASEALNPPLSIQPKPE